MQRVAILLAGGGGARLWPASTPAHPKQFLALHGGASLLAKTAERVAPAVHEICVVTPSGYAEAVAREVPRARVIVEPSARNTFAAVALAVADVLHQSPEAIIGIYPSDHVVTDAVAFGDVVAKAYDVAAALDVIATIGIEPTGPHTGFGYLELRAGLADGSPQGAALDIAAFREKPSPQQAQAYVLAGNTLWNSGMFFARATTLWRELAACNPDAGPALAALREACARTPRTADDEAALAAAFAALPHTSLDYAVMEKTAHIVALVGRFGWSDLGAWDAVAELLPRDDHGNASRHPAVFHDAHDNLVYCDRELEVALVGCHGLIVALVDRKLLVASKASAQEVRAVADAFAGSRGAPRGKDA
ncbi:MAG: mannose-1-phosphate guanylyltransferase [Myxococcales bacterium]|nr:mannose-1-phosphate guanylyltransferase [Myxococcales bacterium]